MESTKKNTSTKSGGKDRKLKQSLPFHNPPLRHSQNTAAVPTQNKASVSRASYDNPAAHTHSEAVLASASNIHQTSHGSWTADEAGQAHIDLLGLAPQILQGYELGDNQQALSLESVGDMRFFECPYHRPILMGDHVNGDEKHSDSMARWLAEGSAEQYAVLHLPGGKLSIHKDCRCSNTLQPEMGMEIEE